MHTRRARVALVVAVLTVVAFATPGAALQPVSDRGAVVGPDDTESAVVPVDACTTITAPGRYALTTDLENASPTQDTGLPAGNETNLSACIVVQSSDVVFDGMGHAVDGKGFAGAGNATENGSFNETERAGFPTGVAVHGLAGETLSNVTVTGVVTTDWFIGVLYDNVTDSALTGTNASDNAYLGVELLAVTDSTVTNNTANRNPFAGLYLATGGNNTVADNRLVDNGLIGIDLFFRSDGNRLLNNTVEGGSAAGVAVVQSVNTTLDGTTVTNVSGNESVFGFAGGVVLVGTGDTLVRNTAATNNSQWDVYVVGCGAAPGTCLSAEDSPDPTLTPPTETPTVVEKLVLTSAMVSFTGVNVAVDAVETPPELPAGQEGIDQYVNATGLGDGATFSPLTFHYDAADLNGAAETDLTVYRSAADSREWTPVCDGRDLDTDADTVSVTVTEFGVVAPLVNDDRSRDGA